MLNRFIQPSHTEFIGDISQINKCEYLKHNQYVASDGCVITVGAAGIGATFNYFTHSSDSLD